MKVMFKQGSNVLAYQTNTVITDVNRGTDDCPIGELTDDLNKEVTKYLVISIDLKGNGVNENHILEEVPITVTKSFTDELFEEIMGTINYQQMAKPKKKKKKQSKEKKVTGKCEGTKSGCAAKDGMLSADPASVITTDKGRKKTRKKTKGIFVISNSSGEVDGMKDVAIDLLSASNADSNNYSVIETTQEVSVPVVRDHMGDRFLSNAVSVNTTERKQKEKVNEMDQTIKENENIISNDNDNEGDLFFESPGGSLIPNIFSTEYTLTSPELVEALNSVIDDDGNISSKSNPDTRRNNGFGTAALSTEDKYCLKLAALCKMIESKESVKTTNLTDVFESFGSFNPEANDVRNTNTGKASKEATSTQASIFEIPRRKRKNKTKKKNSSQALLQLQPEPEKMDICREESSQHHKTTYDHLNTSEKIYKREKKHRDRELKKKNHNRGEGGSNTLSIDLLSEVKDEEKKRTLSKSKTRKKKKAKRNEQLLLENT